MPILAEPLLASAPAYARQVELEKQAVSDGASRYRKQVSAATKRGEGARVHAVEHSRAGWFDAVRAAVVRERMACRQNPERYKRPAYATQMLQVKSSVLAAITIDAGLSRLLKEGGSVSWLTFSYAIGVAVVAELNNQKVRRAKSLQKMRSFSRRVTSVRINRWTKLNLDDVEDSKKLAYSVGDFLAGALISTAAVSDRQGKLHMAFKRYRLRSSDGKRYAWSVRLSDEAMSTIDHWHSAIQRQRPSHLPMLVPPMPWQESRTPMGKKIEGGRITANYPLVSKSTKQQKEAYQHADMTPTFEAIEAISATPGSVDVRVSVVIDHYANIGGRLGMPRMHDEDAPVRPGDDSDEATMAAWKAVRRQWYRETIANASERENFARSLTAMRTMRALGREGFDRFWFDQYLDYRGRSYSRASSYCPQERDLWRASIQLADAKEPGDDGMRAIRVYAAGLYGHDKLSANDRDEWTLDNMGKIQAAAADPESHIDFWSAADKGEAAWQFLQACFALTHADAAARYPVGLDGTSNGLQHYCALSRDGDAAPMVNMTESGDDDVPSSPYTIIAECVAKDVGYDAMTNPTAALLSGRVSRSMVKQPVMTTVYGVTPAGMRSQLVDQLDFIEDVKVLVGVKKDGSPKMASQRWLVAKYLQERITAALAGRFPLAMAMMDWFRDAADAFSARGELMRWTNELGMPIVGRHVGTKTTRVKFATGEYNLRMDDPKAGVRSKKQRDSSAPGVVHSIDAANMMFNGLRCYRDGVAYWANHDCFRTHAADATRLGVIVRDEFVKLHERDIASKLYREWRGMGLDIPPPPSAGTFDLGRVRQARYFVN